MYIYIYIYVYIHMYVCVYVYILSVLLSQLLNINSRQPRLGGPVLAGAQQVPAGRRPIATYNTTIENNENNNNDDNNCYCYV